MKEDPQQDLRQHKRYPLKVPLYVALEGEVFEEDVALESKDISAGGLAFETARDLPLMASSRLVVSQLGDLSAPVLIRGRVVRVAHDPKTDRYTVGVSFTGFVNTTREELLSRIQAWGG